VWIGSQEDHCRAPLKVWSWAAWGDIVSAVAEVPNWNWEFIARLLKGFFDLGIWRLITFVEDRPLRLAICINIDKIRGIWGRPQVGLEEGRDELARMIIRLVGGCGPRHRTFLVK
jgi:hypothetical protein